MTRTTGKKPSPASAAGPGRGQQAKPGRATSTETFGAFVRSLARLESSGKQGRKGQAALKNHGASR